MRQMLRFRRFEVLAGTLVLVELLLSQPGLAAHRDLKDTYQLTGDFESDGWSSDFTATFADGRIKLSTGRSTFALALVNNPLDQPNEIAKPAAGAKNLGTLPADAMVMRTQMLFDPDMGKNAYSVFVPDKWILQGQVTWPPVGAPIAIYELQVSDPVQRVAWRHLPRLAYIAGLRESRMRQAPGMKDEWERRWAEGTITPSGNEVRKLPLSPREYVEKVLVPKLVPEVAAAKDVNVVSEIDLADYAKAQEEKDPFHRKFRSSRFRVTYTTPNGPAEREFVSTLILGKPADDGTMFWMGDVTTCRAPKGKLDALLPTFATIETSVAVQLPWFNVQAQVFDNYMVHKQEIDAEMLRRQAEGIAYRAQVMHDYAKASSDLVSEHIHKDFAEQQAAKAAAQRQFIHYVNNTAAYSNPNDGSAVTLSSNYRYQYINNHNEIIQTNDPTYHPPVDPSTSWQQMEQAK